LSKGGGFDVFPNPFMFGTATAPPTFDVAPFTYAVPEPASICLLGLGGFGLLSSARRRRS
jgi:hypothetical protein